MEDAIKRNFRDRKINREGRILIDFVKDRGWFIANGGIEGDMEENWTYTGARGESVIDYVVVDDDMANEITRLEIGDCIDSDHHPLVMWVKSGEWERRGGKRSNERVHRGTGMRREKKFLGEK